MIVQVKPPKLNRKHEQQFLTMLPLIKHLAWNAFHKQDPEAREERIAEVVAHAFIMYVALVRSGRSSLAYATPLASYGIRRVKSGRRAATGQNVRDVSSEQARMDKGFILERLDHYDPAKNAWRDVLIEDRKATPADLAAARIDFTAWLAELSPRSREIAESLAVGETTGSVAKLFAVSSGRVSQIRRELRESWEEFQGELLNTKAAKAAT
jgi:hypothetical protein